METADLNTTAIASPGPLELAPGLVPAVTTPEDYFRNIRYVTLKVTNGCNLKCSYCNVDADVPSTPRMSIETFQRCADLLIENSEFPFLVLEFHGGEPLIMGDEWLTEAVNYAQAKAKQHGKVVQHPMQTNGTRMTPERLALLRKLGIHIGFSFDGTPEINDTFRMAGKQVEKTIQMMVEKDESFGLILVLSRSNQARMREVMDYFQGLGIVDFRVNFLQPQGLGNEHDLLTGEEMFEGMRDVFEHMADNNCAVIEADIQMAVNRYLAGRDPKPQLSCWEHECQAGRSYVAVNLDGDVHACGTDMFHHRLGHIESGFPTEQVSGCLSKLHRKDAWYVRCFECPAKRICNLSCPTSDHNNLQYREYECDYTQRLYRHFAENEDRVRAVQSGLKAKRLDGHLIR